MDKKLCRGMERAIVFLFGLTVVLMLVQISSRYLFNFSFVWAEEFIRLLFLWMVYLGIAVGFYEGSHIAITMLFDRLQKKNRRRLAIFTDLANALFLATTLVLGAQILWFIKDQRLPVTEIPVYLLYIPFPLCAGLSVFFIARRMWERRETE